MCFQRQSSRGGGGAGGAEGGLAEEEGQQGFGLAPGQMPASLAYAAAAAALAPPQPTWKSWLLGPTADEAQQQVRATPAFCSQFDEFCIEADRFYIKDPRFCIQNDGFHTNGQAYRSYQQQLLQQAYQSASTQALLTIIRFPGKFRRFRRFRRFQRFQRDCWCFQGSL